jgi:peptide/nickel transport system substrate-binding protein
MGRIRGIGAVAIGALCLAAAAGTSSALARPAHHAATGTFVVANTSSVQKLDPDVITNFLDFQALGLIYDTLVQYDDKLNIKPDLATSWKFSNGNKALTLNLRKGVKFTDGTAFTSANVKASLERAKNPKTADASASFIATVTKIVPQGPYKVKLVLARPDTAVLGALTTPNLAMLSTKAIAAGTLAKTPVGTGPYQFAAWTPNQTFDMKANPGYWGGKPKLDAIQIKTIPSEQSIASALQANSVQLGLLSQPQVAEHLPKSFTVEKTLDLSYRALMLQDKTGPLANVNNRLAIACAVDRAQVVKNAVLGEGKPVGPVPLGPYATKPVSAVCPTPDATKAKAYLAKAGNPDGFSFTAMTSNALDATSNAQAITVQSELKAVGITMNIQDLASDAYIQNWLKGKFTAAFAENGADPSPYTMYGRYFTKGANLAVPAGFADPKLANLLVQSDSAATPAKAKRLFRQINTFLTANAVWIWLFDSYDYAVLSSKVHGFHLPPNRDLTSLKSVTLS